MKALRHTLISDGPTDANLIPIINWTLKQAGVPLYEGTHAEFWRLEQKPKSAEDRLVKAVELYPCDVLFFHRDAEREDPQVRFEEIRQAFETAGVRLPVLAVVPVRMLEAWMCFDEKAIRQAAGNPNGREPVSLPALKRVESCPDPKAELKEALLAASGLSGRRRKKFDTSDAFWRIVDCIEDFSPLRELPSFQQFEKAIQLAKESGWSSGVYY